MLEGLDQINWAELEHAYGPAKDVPDALRGFPKQTRQGTDHCLDILYAEVFKNGNRYTSTPKVIPFLYEILADTSLKKRDEIVKYLSYVALGYPDRVLPEGVDTKKWRARDFEAELREAEEAAREEAEIAAALGQDEEEEEEDPRFIPDDKIKVYILKGRELLDLYDIIKEGVPVLCKLLEEVEDNDLVKNSAYILSLFPEAAEESVPALLKSLENCKHTEAKASIMVALGLLWRRNFFNNMQPKVFEEYLAEENHTWLRCAAGIGCLSCCGVSSPSEAVEVIVKLITNYGEFKKTYRWELPYDDGKLNNYGNKVLGLLATGEQNDSLLRPLCDALKRELTMEQGLAVSEVLLSLIFGKDNTNDKKLEDLSEKQVDCLKIVANCDGWGKHGMLFGNYMTLMRKYGLPEARAELKKLLKMEETSDTAVREKSLEEPDDD